MSLRIRLPGVVATRPWSIYILRVSEAQARAAGLSVQDGWLDVKLDGQPLSMAAYQRVKRSTGVWVYYLRLPTADLSTEIVTLELTPSKSMDALAEAVPHISDQSENGRFLFYAGHRLLTVYQHIPYMFKPFFYPLVGPAGRSVTADMPADRLHHHSTWYGYADINGENFWTEDGDEARIIQTYAQVYQGPVCCELYTDNRWLGSRGSSILTDARSFAIIPLPSNQWYLDMQIDLNATTGPVAFGDNNAAGLLALRVSDEITGVNGGIISTADGSGGESATNGRRHTWIDYSGPTGTPTGPRDRKHGIACFDALSNQAHPPAWLTRDYGLVSPANIVRGFKLDWKESCTLRHRLYIHSGNAIAANVAAHAELYGQDVVHIE